MTELSKWMMGLAIICGIITMIIVFIHFLYCTMDIGLHRSIFNGIIGIFWTLHTVGVQGVFLIRLKDVFEDGTYAYSNRTFIILGSIVTIATLSSFSGVFFLHI